MYRNEQALYQNRILKLLLFKIGFETPNPYFERQINPILL